jgi:hypothetical protein
MPQPDRARFGIAAITPPAIVTGRAGRDVGGSVAGMPAALRQDKLPAPTGLCGLGFRCG